MKNIYSLFLLIIIIPQFTYSQAKEKVKARKGIKEGTYEYFYNENLMVKGSYSNNMKSGKWIFYNSSGFTRLEGYYNKDIKDSVWVFYKNGSIINRIYHNNSSGVDTIKVYNNQGDLVMNETRYKDSSRVRIYHTNGNICRDYILFDHKKEGESNYYTVDGRLFMNIQFKNGVPFNIHHADSLIGAPFYYSGNLKDGYGKVIIHVKSSDEAISNYIPRIIYEIADCEINGKYIQYDNHGILYCTGKYQSNIITGRWTFFNENGIATKIANYSKLDSLRQDKTMGIITEIQPEVLGTIDYNWEPSFNGEGLLGLHSHIKNNLNYPLNAAEMGKYGNVFVELVISETGELKQTKIINSVNPDLEKEVLRVVNSMPYWEPAYKDGMPTEVTLKFPVSFHLL